jgi:ppGpp synthetase/RelA/SpoT-type nucleotidyltranferase
MVKAGEIRPQKYRPLTVKKLTAGAQRLADKIGEALCPHPEALLGLQPAPLGGPQRNFTMMINGNSSDNSSGPPSANNNLEKELVGIYTGKASSAELSDLVTAFSVQRRLNIDLSHRTLGLELLLAWGCSPTTIAAYILRPARLTAIRGDISDTLADLIGRRNNLDCFPFNPDFDRKQGGKFLKMMITRESNLEVLLLKTADLFQELSHISQEDQAAAHLALEVFAPLLKILNYSEHCRELEDLAFLHINPEEFRATESQTMDRYQISRQCLNDELNTLGHQLDPWLRARYPDIIVDWRTKGILSEHSKERVVNDLLGIRVVHADRLSHGDQIVEDHKTNSYLVRDAVAEFMAQDFEEVSADCDDYVARPNERGYMALHQSYRKRTADGQGWQVEIQVRSASMDRRAESGECNHIMYKLKGRGFDTILLEGQNAKAKYDVNHTLNLSEGLVYAYDADGRLHKIGPVIDRAKQATVLDFAFHCSRDSGARIVDAEVLRLTPEGTWTTLRADFQAPIENGDRIKLRLANDVQPFSEKRTAAAATELATASVELLKRGQTIDDDRRFDELKQEGEVAYKQAAAKWKAELLAAFTEICRSPRLQRQVRFSLERVYGKLGFGSAGIFYTALGLKAETRQAFLGEILQIIRDSSVAIGYDEGTLAKGNVDLHLLVTNNPGVLLHLFKYFQRFGLELGALDIRSMDSFTLLKVGVRFTDRARFLGFVQKIEDLYHDMPLVSPTQLKAPVKITAKIKPSQMLPFLEEILNQGGHVIEGQANTPPFSSKLTVELNRVSFPLLYSLERIREKLTRKGFNPSITR